MQTKTRVGLVFAVVGLTSQAQAQTTKLQPETVKAFDRYVKTMETDVQKKIDGQKPFLWVDEESRRRFRVLRGEIVVQKFTENINVPNGIIHDWGGTMFIPGATVQDVLAVLQDYGRYHEIYPEVVESKALRRQGDVFRAHLRFKKRQVLTVVLNTEHETRFSKVSDKRWHVRSHSTRIAEVENAGTPKERELPVGEDHGFLWRTNAYWFLEQADDGVFAECGTLTLTRDVPAGLGWMINPFIQGMPRDSLTTVLLETRKAVKARAGERPKGTTVTSNGE